MITKEIKTDKYICTFSESERTDRNYDYNEEPRGLLIYGITINFTKIFEGIYAVWVFNEIEKKFDNTEIDNFIDHIDDYIYKLRNR